MNRCRMPCTVQAADCTVAVVQSGHFETFLMTLPYEVKSSPPERYAIVYAFYFVGCLIAAVDVCTYFISDRHSIILYTNINDKER
jgi:hypothetical protein